MLTSTRVRALVPAALLVLGLLQIAGDLVKVRPLRALAAATGASPAPKVFSSVNGLETYSSTFEVRWSDETGLARSLVLTPELYEQVRGPYNRRNTYGAVLSYGPVLRIDPAVSPMFNAVGHYALCEDAPILKELGIDPTKIRDLRVVVRPRAPIPNLPLEWSPQC